MIGEQKALAIDRRARILVRGIESGTRKHRPDDIVYLAMRATYRVLADVLDTTRAALTLKELFVREMTLFQPNDVLIDFDYLVSSFVESSPRYLFKHASTHKVASDWLFDAPVLMHALARVFFSCAAQELAWGLAIFALHATQGGCLDDKMNGLTITQLIVIYAGASLQSENCEPSPGDASCVGERLPPAKGREVRIACIRGFYGKK